MLQLLLAVLCHAGAPDAIRVEVRFATSARAEPLTGRAYVAFARSSRSAPIQQTGSTGVPLFGVDVADLAPAGSTWNATTASKILVAVVDPAGFVDLAGDYGIQSIFTVCVALNVLADGQPPRTTGSR